MESIIGRFQRGQVVLLLCLAVQVLFGSQLRADGVVRFMVGTDPADPGDVGWSLNWTYEAAIDGEVASSLVWRQGIETLTNMGYPDVRESRVWWSLDQQSIYVKVISATDPVTGAVYVMGGASFESEALAEQDARKQAWAMWPWSVFSQGYAIELSTLITPEGSQSLNQITGGSSESGTGGGSGGSGGGGGPPVIVTDLGDLYLEEGQSGVFVVNATGSSPLSYRWLFGANAPVTRSTGTYSIGYADLWMDGLTVKVEVSNAYGTVSSRIATLHVRERAPNLVSAEGRFVPEGDSARQEVDIEVSLSWPAEHTVYLDFTTADSSAKAYVDYIPQEDTLIIPRGEMSATITLEVIGNAFLEPDRTFQLIFERAVNAVIHTPVIFLTIEDDDGEVESYGTLDSGAFFEVVDTAADRARITALSATDDGGVYIGGLFASIGGVARTSLARIDLDGSVAAAFAPALAASGGSLASVVDVLADADGSLWVLGNMEQVNGEYGTMGTPPDYSQERLSFVKLDVEGSRATGWRNLVDHRNETYSPDGRFLLAPAGADFIVVAGTVHDRTTGEAPLPWHDLLGPGPSYAEISATPSSRWMLPDGRLLAGFTSLDLGGGFRSLLLFSNVIERAPGINSRYVVENFRMEAPLGAVPETLEIRQIVDVDSYGRILLHVNYRNTSGYYHMGLYRLNADGTRDSQFQWVDLAQYRHFAHSFAVQPDGRILIGGGLELPVNDTLYRYLARLNGDGTLDSSFKFKGSLPATETVLEIEPVSDDILWFRSVETGGSNEYHRVRRVFSGPISAPSVEVDAIDQKKILGTQASFAVEATGWEPLHYQWYLDDVPQDGNQRSLQINRSEESFIGAHTVRVVVSNPFGEVSSRSAVLQVIAPDQVPIIETQPVALGIYTGEVPRFGVQASSPTLLRYQWYYDFSPVDGATGPALIGGIDTSAASSPRAVYVEVSNDEWTVRSDIVTLQIDAFEDYETWRKAVFSPFFARSPVADPEHDFNGDGISNYTAFLMGIDPAETAGDALQSTRMVSRDSQYDYVEYTASNTASHLVVSCERSVDMLDWTPVEGEHVLTTSSGRADRIRIRIPRLSPDPRVLFYRARYRIDQ